MLMDVPGNPSMMSSEIPRKSKMSPELFNGSDNLPDLKREGDIWKVRLIEEDFHKLMWNVEDV